MSRPIISYRQGVGNANVYAKNKPSESSWDATSNNLWVGNLAADVSDSDLRNLFEKYGGVDSISCYPARSYAFIYLRNAQDAKRAKDNLQGVVLRGNPLKIDFAKPAKPCKSLWVSGISTSVSKEDLKEEFSRFGKIEDFKFQWDKNAAYIDYFRLEDASKALKAMHGKKKGGTPIRVDYLRSHPRKNNLPSEGQKVHEDQPSNILLISYPSTVHIDEQMLHNALILFGEIENIRNIPSRNCSFVEFRSVEEARCAKEGLQGKLFNNPSILITFSLNEPAPKTQYVNGFLPVNGHNPMSDLNLRSPPSNQTLYSPLASMKATKKSTHGTRGAFDYSQSQREPKRLRTDCPMPLKETYDQVYIGGPQVKGGVPSSRRLTSQSLDINGPDVDYIWRGVIAKGGAPVCRARCLPIGDWIGCEIPEVVNCTARTGLDTLAKHYTDAIGFDIIFFLPDSEEDFASYTEFLRYLGDRNRAGVAKFNDGTTLFLVPPSEFLTRVLNISGPDRLYGVVLKFPQLTSNNVSSPSINQPYQYINKLDTVSHNEKIQVGSTLHSQAQFFPSNTVNKFNTEVFGNSDIQGLSYNNPHNEAVASLTSCSGQTPQGVQFTLPMQATQQYQLDYPQYNADAPVFNPGVTSSSQVHGSNVYEPHNKTIDQMQQTLEVDTDKNERYQSTLQFAASLLFQIQQKQAAMEAGGNH